MALIFSKLLKNVHLFRRLTGIYPNEFIGIIKTLTLIWEKQLKKTYIRPGRHYKYTLNIMVVMILIYYRSYITQEFLSILFHLDKSNVCRIIKKLEPLLAKILPIPQQKMLSKYDIETMIIDVTEQEIERPKRNQKAYYSGKNKMHSLKTELRINGDGKIIQLSKSYPGRVHDFSIFKQEPRPPSTTSIYADSGYQGLKQEYKNAFIPYKKSKLNPLCNKKKNYNQALSSIRVGVEHKIREIKIFKIIGNRYRNKRKGYDLKFKIIVGLVNMKNGYPLVKRVA